MTKIRESLSTVFAVFAGVFVVYIVLDWGMDITGRKQAGRQTEAQEIGKINGESLLYKDFAEQVKQAVENQKTQTGTEPDENQTRAIRDQIWNQLIEQKLFDEAVKHFGITVTDQEIVDWVRGDNPPEFLRPQFTDSLGNFNRQAYESAILDPKNKSLMVRIEDILRKQREREKVQSILLASLRVSEGDILQKFSDQYIRYDADYLLFDPNLLVKDDEVKTTDDDLRRFYNEHSEEFKIEATRKLKYVMFTEVAAKGDTDAVVSEMEDILKRAKEGSDFNEMAKLYSETPPSDVYFKHGELSPDRETAIFGATPGTILGPQKDFDGYHLMKVNEFRPGKDEFLRASHILISIENNDSVKALKQSKTIVAEIKSGKDFGALALQYSKDPGSGQKGGDLGWFGKGRMVKPFEEAAYKAKVGQVVGPVRTQFGYHIIKVTARDNREVKITDIRMAVHISSQTKESVLQQSQDFAYVAKNGDFVKEAQQAQFTVNETPSFQKSGVIPGIGVYPTVTKFAFNNKLNTVSDVVSLQNGYGVFMVTEIKDAGIRPFDELKANLEARVKREKKMEKLKSIVADLRQKLAPTDSLQKLNGQLPNLSAQHLASVAVSTPLPGIGRDGGFTGGLTSLNVGEISKPIDGTRGYYLIKLLNKTPFDTTVYRAQHEVLRTQLLAERRGKFVNDWLENMKKAADIVDNRDIFYR